MPTTGEILALVVVILAMFSIPLALRQALGFAVSVLREVINIWRT